MMMIRTLTPPASEVIRETSVLREPLVLAAISIATVR